MNLVIQFFHLLCQPLFFNKNAGQFTWKHMCQSLFFNNAAGLGHRGFPLNFAKFLRTPFFTEHLQGTFSQYSMGETVFYSFHDSNGCLAASDLFYDVYTINYVLSIPLSFLKNVIHQVDNKNKWLLHPASFTVKYGWFLS